jgi:hypothetical protein
MERAKQELSDQKAIEGASGFSDPEDTLIT